MTTAHIQVILNYHVKTDYFSGNMLISYLFPLKASISIHMALLTTGCIRHINGVEPIKAGLIVLHSFAACSTMFMT